MEQEQPPQFLDVPRLVELSTPRRSPVRAWQLAGIFMLVVVASTYFSTQGGQAAMITEIVSGVAMFALVVVMGVISWNIVRKTREEQNSVEAIDELIRLRRWPEAGMMIERLLSRPTRTPQARAHGLIFLTSVLARYNRFEDAITVQNYLLENLQFDPGTVHGLRLSRAMAMLREDHLFDADKAINELRRQVSRAERTVSQGDDDESQAESESQPAEPSAPQALSAGLALVEIYRDVKTGHPQEAIDLFVSTAPAIRDQLGHRVADAHVLVAKAYDLLNRPTEAQTSYERATLLAPPAELHRRYPETAVLAQKYQPAIAPKEAA